MTAVSPSANTNTASSTEAPPDLALWRTKARELQAALNTVILGQEHVLELLTIAIFARGHVLLEGDVGVGKTTLLKAAARALGGAYERIEGTIDLMPADLIYHTWLGEDGRPRVDPGPALRHGGDLAIFFFNEINRARPQVHSLLLRLMAEHSLTAFNREWRFPHLLVFADRNRIEREETFELPAAARDRFFMEISIETPREREVRRALAFDPRFHDTAALLTSIEEGFADYKALNTVAGAIQRSVQASPAIERYALDLWDGVRHPATAGIALEGVDLERAITGGASPRGMSFLLRAARVAAWLSGRDMLVPEDIRRVFAAVMGHRIFLDPIFEARQSAIVRALIAKLFASVPSP